MVEITAQVLEIELFFISNAGCEGLDCWLWNLEDAIYIPPCCALAGVAHKFLYTPLLSATYADGAVTGARPPCASLTKIMGFYTKFRMNFSVEHV